MGLDNATHEVPAADMIVNVKKELNPDNSPFHGSDPIYSNPLASYCPFSETLIQSLTCRSVDPAASSASPHPACAFQDPSAMNVKANLSVHLLHPGRPIAGFASVGSVPYPDQMVDVKICLKRDSPEVDSDTDVKQQQQASKRRKNQVKRVVHVPITGAVLKQDNKIEAPPSDSWAWRKYGQKPIKGSPYPRGYYRCSSSKGCSARKQVEKSRSDPTVLIVTYTSEHNHPWPTRGRNTNHTNAKSSIVSTNTGSLDTIGNEEYPSAESPEGHDAEATPHYSDFASILNNCCNVYGEEEKTGALHMVSESAADINTYLDMNLVEDVTRYFSRSSSTQEDDFFDDLGELPELSAFFGPNSLVFGSESADCHRFQQQETLSL